MLEYVKTLAMPQSVVQMCDMLRTMPDGCVVELGVYQGGSALELYKVCEEQGRELWLYDTFSGIPFMGAHDSHKVGDFGDTDAEKVSRLMPKARVIQGIFPFSLAAMPNIAFAHIDADQYDSIRMALYVLGPMMVKNGVMWFDDVGCLDGANKALAGWREHYKKPAFVAECGKVYVRF